MNRPLLITTILAALTLSLARGQAEIPPMILYQGYVTVNTQSFTGAGLFKFALVDKPGTTTYWSHDGTSAGGAAPATTLPNIAVFNGLYSVLLGDRSITGMTQPVPTSVFASHSNVFLRVWFDDGVNGLQQLAPDTRIASVGFAMVAAAVSAGAIDSAALAPNLALGGNSTAGTLTLKAGGDQTGAVLDAGIADGSASLKLYDATGAFATVRLMGAGSGSAGGQMLLKNGSGNTTLEFDAQDGPGTTAGGAVRFKKNDGKTVLTLEADLANGNSGLRLYDAAGTQETVRLTGAHLGTNGAFLSLKNTNGNQTISLNADDAHEGGLLELSKGDGTTTARLEADIGSGTGGLLLYDAAGAFETVRLVGEESVGAGGQMLLKNGSGNTTLEIDAQGGLDKTAGSVVRFKKNDGTTTIKLDADDDLASGRLELSKSDGTTTARLEADIGSGNGGLLLYDPNGGESIRLGGSFLGTGAGFLQFRNLAGVATMTLNGDSNGEGKITTQVIQITGGADLSEQFDVVAGQVASEPGMIVCLDTERPGKLRLSERAYDSTVAGIMSGAGGVKPGMLMGQSGTLASGKHPVALTGRVYCWVDAAYGAVQTGDLITTSATPGHGMKADARRAAGAIVGKAITPLKAGKGLVLVLVSLQ